MKIYISGKITGLPIEEAKAMFQAAEDYIKNNPKFSFLSPVEIINPFKLDHSKAYALERIMEQEKNYPEESKSVNINDVWCAYMDVDVAIVLRCSAVYMLNNWGSSKGARVEYAIAKELNLSIFHEQ